MNEGSIYLFIFPAMTTLATPTFSHGVFCSHRFHLFLARIASPRSFHSQLGIKICTNEKSACHSWEVICLFVTPEWPASARRMSYVQGIGSLAAGVALGVLATSTYFRLWDGKTSSIEGTLLRFTPDLSTQTIRSLDRNFAVSYDRRTRIPLWTIEHLTRETITMGKNVDRGNAVFREDSRIHPFFRSTNQDYSGNERYCSIWPIDSFLSNEGSGFDRGHMIPSADHRHSQESMNNTFFLSNIAPQVGLRAVLDDCHREASSIV